MPRIPTVFAALALACASTAVCAGDFMPRSTSGYAVADDPGARSMGSDAGPATPMSETETPGPARVTAPARGGQVGADVTASVETRATPAATADAEDKPAPSAQAAPHKARALRWQSLLPGVMK